MTCPTCKSLQGKLAIAEEALQFFAERERLEKELHRMKYMVTHGNREIRKVAQNTLDRLQGKVTELPPELQAAIAEAMRKAGSV